MTKHKSSTSLRRSSGKGKGELWLFCGAMNAKVKMLFCSTYTFNCTVVWLHWNIELSDRMKAVKICFARSTFLVELTRSHAPTKWTHHVKKQVLTEDETVFNLWTTSSTVAHFGKTGKQRNCENWMEKNKQTNKQSRNQAEKHNAATKTETRPPTRNNEPLVNHPCSPSEGLAEQKRSKKMQKKQIPDFWQHSKLLQNQFKDTCYCIGGWESLKRYLYVSRNRYAAMNTPYFNNLNMF